MDWWFEEWVFHHRGTEDTEEGGVFWRRIFFFRSLCALCLGGEWIGGLMSGGRIFLAAKRRKRREGRVLKRVLKSGFLSTDDTDGHR